MTSGEILDTIEAAWVASSRRHRDDLLETGRLLLDYLNARLREGAHVKRDAKRTAAGLSRRVIVQEAADRLGVRRYLLNDSIRAAAVASLLTPGSGLGGIGWSSVRTFAVMIERPVRVKKVRRGQTDEHGRTLADVERWEVREPYREIAPALFRRAIEEAWDLERVKAEVYGVVPVGNRAAHGRKPRWTEPSGRPSWTGPDPDREPAARVKPTARVRPADLAQGAPQDVADLVLEIVQAASAPVRLARLILARLERHVLKEKAGV